MKNKKFSRTDEPETIILHRDEPRIQEMEAKLNELLPYAERLVIEYGKLPYAQPEANISHILNNTGTDAKAYRLSLIPDEMQIAGLKLNKQRAAQFFDLPSSTDFDQALNECKSRELEKYQAYFKIVDGICILNDSAMNLFIEQHSVIVKTPDEIEMYQIWQNFLTSAMEFDRYLRKRADLILMDHLSPIRIDRYALPSEKGLRINHSVFAMLKKKIATTQKN
jgi:hypothetical protein